MVRGKKTYAFWNQQEPSIESMFLKNTGPLLDAAEKAEILQLLPDLKGQRVLELGAGIGRYTSCFAQVAEQVTAVEFIPQFIEMSRTTNCAFSNILYLCSDVMELSFSDASFDCIFTNALMMYLDDVEVALLEERFYRWLKKGGTLFFRENCTPSGSHRDDGYYVHYRSLYFYTELFSRRLQLVEQDSLKLFEREFANPFQCYWIYTKTT